LAVETFSEIKNIIMIGGKPPVAFFAYPGSPSECYQPGTRIFTLARVDEDISYALEALAHAVDAERTTAPVSKFSIPVRPKGDITPEKVELLQKVDKIFIEELHNFKLYKEVWQAFAVLLPVQSVGVMGDFRTYEKTVALRAVTSTDGMTADWARLPHEFLQAASSRITSEVRGVNRVVYDISSKPPSTIEWE
ncbi:MAG: hypothetical protein AAB336_01135, partial [Acidobacteriota bacterium]